jgi:lambda family phage portal protein
VLLRRRRRRVEDGLPLPFQVQILEADYLDTTKEGEADEGGYIREGIERDAIGRRVAYWLYDEHPGTSAYRPRGLQSRRIPARDIIHLYRQDRPGQLRGVTWFAPIALNLQDLADGIDAHLMRQKIAACFAAFRVRLDAEPTTVATVEDKMESIRPGRIQTLAPGEDVRFSAPPAVEGFDEFNKVILRMVAGGLGITYESLSGDLSNVNFSSARMGRMEMNRNVSAWQHLMMVPQMMDPIGQWFLEAAALQAGRPLGQDVRLTWVPPPPVLVDPAKEIAAAREAVLAGFKSRQQVIREQGHDPERVLEEQKEDAAAADLAGLVFDSDARVGRVAPAVTPPAQQEPGDQNTGDQNE